MESASHRLNPVLHARNRDQAKRG